jgi:signal transduction histidine kinase/ActR/RegA family two-component response regulator
MKDFEIFQRRYERERRSRLEAESLLEKKSLELFETNKNLVNLTVSLEESVRRRTEQLKKARDEALVSNQVKSEFISNLTHELRTPLNGLMSVLELIDVEGELTNEQSCYLTIGRKSADTLLELINDILDLNKVDANKLQLESIAFNARSLLQDAVDLFNVSAEEKNLELIMIESKSIPPWLSGDPARIRQVVSNLLGNAVKFASEGRIIVDASYSAAGLLEFRVADMGIGISQADINKIWQPFTQADNSITRKYGGTGLGLTISRRLCELMDGTISIESTLNEGTTFSVSLPLPIAAAPKVARCGTNAVGTFDSSKILLVDDNSVNLLVGAAMLKSLGLQVGVAASGEEALAMVKLNNYQLVLLDLMMPGMSGFDTLRAIRALDGKTASVPVVALTAQADSDTKDQALACGFDGYATKPIKRTTLYTTLAKWFPVGQGGEGNAESQEGLIETPRS